VLSAATRSVVAWNESAVRAPGGVYRGSRPAPAFCSRIPSVALPETSMDIVKVLEHQRTALRHTIKELSKAIHALRGLKLHHQQHTVQTPQYKLKARRRKQNSRPVSSSFS